jgi:hypothetical protein|tara:strand:+ start:4867 stop:5046 length:180 start_codon:yes stop_codon:yes gene_type:complete
MSRQRAINIVRNISLTISNMKPIQATVTNELFPPTRTTKKKLQSIADRLIRRYKLAKDN